MLTLVLGWAVMAAAMVGLIRLPDNRPVLLYWAVISLGACVLGALAIASQPMGQATLPGRLGASVVRWGFRATQGKLGGATAISWVLWLAIGAAAITAGRARGDLTYRLMLLAWVVDFGALMYVIGVWLTMRTGNPTLLMLGAVLVGLIGISATLWFGNGAETARHRALMLAGGPPLVLGVGYGLFLLVVLTVGRNARWN